MEASNNDKQSLPATRPYTRKPPEANERRAIRGAIATGFGLPEDKVCVHIGVTKSTLRTDKKNYPDIFSEWARYTEGLVELFLSDQVTKRKASATAESRIISLFDRSFKVTEKLVTRAEELIEKVERDSADPNVEITIKELIAVHDVMMQVHEKITMWSAKFAASEAPKRLQIDSNVKHEHVLLLDDAVDGLSNYYRHIGLPMPDATPISGAGYIDITRQLETSETSTDAESESVSE